MLEWRAARTSDPVKRLQFLQRARASPIRAPRNLSLGAITVGLAFLVLTFLGLAWASTALVQPTWKRAASPHPRFTAQPRSSQKPEAAPGRVWLVEANDRFELYSNGLRLETQFVTNTQPRAYLSLSREGMDTHPARLRFDPVGIVFHTTESHMAPFEEEQNGTLRRV